jgi:hypothetical protein
MARAARKRAARFAFRTWSIRRNEVTVARLILPAMPPDNASMIPAQPLPLRQLACARCGAAFECGSASADGTCWCMEETVRLPMPAPGAADCLCPACLRSAASAQRTGSPA